jgi:RimJ/RimL family protein N-acetyltransferase
LENKINNRILDGDDMNNDIKIRKIEEKDATIWFKFVNKVWRTAYKNIFPEEVFLEKEKNIEEKEKNFNEIVYNNNEQIALVAEYENKIVGIMVGTINSNYEYFNSEYADLQGLYIAPNFQGKGIGSSFKKMFENWARKNGANKYVIGVLKDNQKARAVYEKWGGKLSTYEQDFYKLGIAYKEVFYTYDL